MDILSLEFLSYVVAVIVVIAASLYTYVTWHFNVPRKMGINGPKPLPFTGTVTERFTTTLTFGEYDFAQKKKYGKLVAYFDGRQPNIVVHDPDIIRDVMVKEFPHFHARRKLYLRSFLRLSVFDQQDLGEFKHIRNMLTPFFSSGKLKQQIEPLNQCVDSMMTKIEEFGVSQKSIDVRELMDAFTLDAIAATAFGVHVQSQNDPNEPFIKTFRTITKLFGAPPTFKMMLTMMFPHVFDFIEAIGLGDIMHALPLGMVEFFYRTTDNLMKRRLEGTESRPDFIQAMVQAHNQQLEYERKKKAGENPDKNTRGLTDMEIQAQSMLFFLAGFDPTATTLTFFAYCLALNQDVQDKLAAEVRDILGDKSVPSYDDTKRMTYMDMCLSESLRLYPPIVRTVRQTTEDITLQGIRFPKNIPVTIPIASIQRDPEFWDNPEKFDPERFTAEAKKGRNQFVYIPFGLGPRNCIGKRLAQKEIKLVMSRILQRYKLVTNEHTQIPVVFKKSFLPVPERPIQLSVVPRDVQ